MKNLIKALVLFGLTSLLSVNGLFAQVFILDETGSPGGPIPAQIGPDPSGGLAANVLFYTLPFAVQPGDLVLAEPNQPTFVPSDVIRFFNVGATSVAIFYSDIEAGEPPNPADSGIPLLSANGVPVLEVGPEGNNGAVWTPGPGQPGFGSIGTQVTYQIISDAPEPGSVAVMLVGAAALLAVNRFRRNGLNA